ncbi:hypothetical protein IWW34DRAFT_636844, partial [Fusarium oxysporum f. sp. albedinis]
RYSGIRSTSTLTPAQLARKRANDRVAQRAIRARTKEHIERLEHELAELKSKQDYNQTIQELLCRNKAIEKELIQLEEIRGALMAPVSFSVLGLTPQQLSFPDKLLTSTACNGNLITGSDAIPSPCGSTSPIDYDYLSDYDCLSDYSQQYTPLSNDSESLASTVCCPIPSNILTPASSADYSAGYIPINVPTSALPSNNTNYPSIDALYDKNAVKVEADGLGHYGTTPQELGEEVRQTQYQETKFRLSNPPLHPYSHPYVLH